MLRASRINNDIINVSIIEAFNYSYFFMFD